MNHFSKALPFFVAPKFSIKLVPHFVLKDFKNIFLYRSSGKIKRYLSEAYETEEFILHGAIKRIIEDK
ncbi:MAG: hypothetical protein ABJA90_01495 [Ginsengibacter sp.]